MSAIQQLPRPEQLVDMVGHAAAVKLAMDGAFDDKIKELKAATKALQDAQTVASTVKQAQKLWADTEAHAAEVRDELEKLTAAAKAASEQAQSTASNVAARESAVASRESAADNRQRDQDAREQAILDAQAKRDAALTSREAVVEKAEQTVIAAQKKLISDQAGFNQRLEALKV